MVTEVPEGQEVKRVGAVASLGGMAEDVFEHIRTTTTAGHRRLFWPLVLLIAAFVPIVLNIRTDVTLVFSAVSLLLIAIWVVADDARGPR